MTKPIVFLFNHYSMTVQCQVKNTCFYPTGIYLFRANNKYTRPLSKNCSKLIIKIPERRHQSRSGVFIVNFKHISPIVLMFAVCIVFEQVLVGCVAFGFHFVCFPKRRDSNND